jgi:hypothetical protein
MRITNATKLHRKSGSLGFPVVREADAALTTEKVLTLATYSTLSNPVSMVTLVPITLPCT